MFLTVRTWIARSLMLLGFISLGGAVGLFILAKDVAQETGLDSALVPMFKAAYFIKELYIEPVDPQITKQRLLAGLIDHLDPHTAYLPPEEAKSWKEDLQGSYGGIGIGAKAGADKKTLVIRDVFEPGPAGQSGLRGGDTILSIDGESVEKRSQVENFKRIRGPIGTSVALEILPKDGSAKRLVKVQRAAIELPTAQWALLDSDRGKVFWIRESRFNEDMVRQTAQAILAANKDADGKVAGILLDLRDNGGGLITSAVGLSAFFGEPGAVVVTAKGRDSKQDHEWRANIDDWSPGALPVDDVVSEARKAAPWVATAPMAVLVNRRSASASEIVAGALRDWKRALIVGNDTFGKGSVQTVISLGEGNGSMKVTTSRYYTPGGKAIQAVGVPVDVKVESALDRGLREADLPQHLKGEAAKENRGEAVEMGPDGIPMPKAPLDVKDPKIAAELAMEEERSTFSSRLKPPKGDAYVTAGIKALKP